MNCRLLSIAMLLLSCGCLITPDVFDDARARFVDTDGDGISEFDGDCDPNDPATHPGATELCDGKDNDCDRAVDNHPPGPIWFLDADQDGHGTGLDTVAACERPAGFVADAGDCDDNDASRFPGQAESCDDRDDDCDGTIDEGAPADRIWYPDADGDGHGSSATPIQQCAAPGEGYVLLGDDCDDTQPEVFPGADELCNDRDDNCDGSVDEAPTVDPLSWAPDRDADGYGDSDAEAVLEQCLFPGEPYVLEGGDCDDTDGTIFPGADELCNGIDDNCDGEIDDPPTIGDGTWYPDHDGDGYGDDAASERSCSAEPGFVSRGGDCDDGDEEVSPAATEICNDGADNDCDGSPNSCVWDSHIQLADGDMLQGRSDDSQLGASLAVGDLDGDGTMEWWSPVLSGAPETASVVTSDLLGWRSSSTAPALLSPDLELTDMADGFGRRVAIGDVDGDGWDDLIGATTADSIDGDAKAGGAGVIFGPLTASSPGLDWELAGDGEGLMLGSTTQLLADLNGDGARDFGIGAPDHDSGTGIAYVFTQVGSGTQDAAQQADITIFGATEGSHLGTDFTAADIDGDGIHDLVVGSEDSFSRGAVHIFLGTVRGEVDSEDADTSFYGETIDGDAGRSVASFSDVNGDGYADVATGAMSDQHASGRGSAYIIWGDTSLSDNVLSDAEIKFRGDRSDEWFGARTVNVGDLDLDGSDDLVVTTRDELTHTVHAYLYFGPFNTTQVLRSSADADVTMVGDETDDHSFESLVPFDVNDDEVLDLIVGSPTDDAGDRGTIYIAEGIGY